MGTFITIVENISLYVESFDKTIQTLIKTIKKSCPCIVVPCSLNDISFFQHKKYVDMYSSVDFLVPDGMPVVWYAKYVKKIHYAERIYGPKIMTTLLKNIHVQSLNHIFIGPSKETNKKLHTSLQRNGMLPNNSYFVAPPNPFNHDEWEAFAKQYFSHDYDVCWIGISSPLQVELAVFLKKFTSHTIFFCVGAAFDFISGQKASAPPWIQNIGFEWLFRLLHDPKRLSKRYLRDIPLSLIKLFVLRKINL